MRPVPPLSLPERLNGVPSASPRPAGMPGRAGRQLLPPRVTTAETVLVAVAEPVAVGERVAVARPEVAVVAGRGALPHFLEPVRLEAAVGAPILDAPAVAVAEAAGLSRVADVAAVDAVVAAIVTAIDAVVAVAVAVALGEAPPELVAIEIARAVGALVAGVGLAI